MSDYYGGYSLYRGTRGGVPMPSVNDWMNPMGMFPTMALNQQNFFKGTPVRAPETLHRAQEKSSHEKVKEPFERPGASQEKLRPRLPGSNAPSRAIKRMQMFEARDWTSIQSAVATVQPIDAGLAPVSSPEETPATNLWQPSIPLHQQYSRANWLRPNRDRMVTPRHKGLVAIGESDSDSCREDQEEKECEHEQWMKELVATVNSVMAENELETSGQVQDHATRNQFQFEWLHQAKRGGVDLSRD